MIVLPTLRRLRRDTSGLAMIEFALTLPIILAMGGYGTELSFLAVTNLRVSQYALNLADNASRVGVAAGGGVTQLREADLNDVLQGTRKESEAIKLGTNGRVTLSSLENIQQSYDSTRVQRIHWQRCFGLKNGGAYTSPSGTGFASSYGTTTASAGSDATQANAGTTAATGMGDTGRKVNAYQNSGVMFVEVNFQYKPLFGAMFVNPQIVHYTASFTVRDNRDFTRIWNPTPTSTASTCDKYTI